MNNKVIKQSVLGAILFGMVITSVFSVAYAQYDDYGYTDIPSTYTSSGYGYTDIPSSYGSGYTDIPSGYTSSGYGYTDIPSTYGYGYTNISSTNGYGYTDISSTYGSGYTNIPSTYTSSGYGYTDIPSSYGSGYTDIPSGYTSSGYGYTDIPSTYGYGYTDIPSTYGYGYTDIPSTYGYGYTDIPSTYNYGSGYTDIPSAYQSGTYGSGYTNIPSAYESGTYGSGYTNIPSAYQSGTYGSGYTNIPSAYESGTYIPGATYGNGYGSVGYGSVGYGSVGYGSVGYGSVGYGVVGSISVGSTYPTPVVTQITCPAGSVLTNNQCINSVTGTVITTTVCPAGTTVSGTNCINNVNGAIVTQIVCPTGSSIVGNQCVTTVNPPVTTITNCPANTQFINNTCQQIINTPVVITQTCWDGSIISVNSVCASQYKVCANGVSVPVNQACYVSSTPIYMPREVITFNNVVTSVATQITNTSGRCNGIGLIANNAPSTGWFEYGETPSLGRTTASASIGSSDTAPFSNVLANLKPTTKYYCRAVMQNKYGLVKGEIVSFVTTKKATTYVKPVATPTKSTTKTTTKKNDVVCSDGSTVSVKNESASSLLTKGEKLISVSLEKTGGKLASGETVNYKVSYKNLTDTRLTGVLIKVTLPQEVTFTSSTAGNFDAVTRTLILNQDTLDPHTESTILLSGTVLKDAPLGKSVVTNVYVLYSVPGTKAQDEVTAYLVGSIVANADVSLKDTGAKNVVGAGAGKGFMPNTLIEWLALLAILFIIFILGRSIYASYKEDEGAKH